MELPEYKPGETGFCGSQLEKPEKCDAESRASGRGGVTNK
jgi:hypothetical protein